MKSGYFVDAAGKCDKENDRRRSDVLVDFQINEWIKDELSGSPDEITGDLLEQELPDDTIYFVEKTFYHTCENVDPEIARKVNAGPDNRGWAGDIDVGKIRIPDGKITRVELKSPGRIPALEERKEIEQTYDPIKHGEKQNRYMKRLLDNIEVNEDVEIPYSSRTEAWNDVVNSPVYLDELPQYTEKGSYLCSPKTRETAEESELIKTIDSALFKGRMFGGGENILENM